MSSTARTPAVTGCQAPAAGTDAPKAACGAAVAADQRCLAHLHPDQRTAYLATLTSGTDIDVHGVTFTRELLEQLLRALDDDTGKARFGNAVFSGATFVDEADFRGATFTEVAEFSDATFAGVAIFDGATFKDAVFTRSANVAGTTFTGEADFRRAIFSGDVRFSVIEFAQSADFSAAIFSGNVAFGTVNFVWNATFAEAQIPGRLRLRCMVGTLDLRGVQVSGELTVESAAIAVKLQEVRAAGRVGLRLRGPSVDLSDAVFTGPVTVHGLRSSPAGLHDTAMTDRYADWRPEVAIESLRGTDAERLVLTDVDLSSCLFVGMHRVDQLRLDGECTFATDPSGTRQVLAEEKLWRFTWMPPRSRNRWFPGRLASDAAVVEPARLEVLYRQLRKAIEDSKNEPGAADFYYGEMEMRRIAATRMRDKVLLWLYWASSGYALRARRALVWLAVTIAATIAALTLAGFPASGSDLNAHGTLTGPTGPQPITVTVHQTDPVTTLSARGERAIEITLNAVIFRGTDTQLTTTGRYIDILARLLGPLLLGLSVLAVRNQVKR
jgi:uncharacterized protein YjbI with pentapeptide repeats